jgi:hypothetical protein
MDATGLAIALVQVCKRLYETIESMKDAPTEAKQLQSRLQELQGILDSVGSTFDHISSATLQALKDEVNLSKFFVPYIFVQFSICESLLPL